MDCVTVESVEPRPLACDRLHGFDLGAPVAGDAFATHSLAIRGWLLGKAARADAVEVLQDGQVVLRMPVSLARQDLAAAFPDLPAAARSGFSGALGSLRLRACFELRLRGVLDDGVTVPLATIRGSRSPARASACEPPSPLIVTTLGRTGSTWCVWLLQSHPEIVAHDPFSNDARVGSYWMSVLQTLADPNSYLRQLYPGRTTGANWWVGAEAGAPRALRNAELSTWLASERITELAAVCRERICSFYDFQAAAQGKEPAFFVEKHLPRQICTDLLRELYPGSAEVVLVRDPRDMLCSILAFNRKRGYSAFGRERAASDAEYLETARRSGEALLKHLRSEGRGAHLVRYEDLTLRPVETLEPLLESIGLDPGEATGMVERASVSVDGMDHHMTASSAVASIGRWRRELDPELAQRCDEALSPLAAEFGYERSGA